MTIMLEPSIDQLQKKIKSKYTLVTISARRARELRETDNLQVENSKSNNYVGMALEEVLDDKLVLDQE